MESEARRVRPSYLAKKLVYGCFEPALKAPERWMRGRIYFSLLLI